MRLPIPSSPSAQHQPYSFRLSSTQESDFARLEQRLREADERIEQERRRAEEANESAEQERSRLDLGGRLDLDLDSCIDLENTALDLDNCLDLENAGLDLDSSLNIDSSFNLDSSLNLDSRLIIDINF
jgi:hypothetical protein